ncbi:hypothetical protein EDD22DRAFT_951165 [Suillus occidentalis]|nr:hypothetical protein EDD22DRAFT_951165 [Suillus occidentalis]
MPVFNASMLASTPSPGPEVHPSGEDAHMEDSVVETDVDRLLKGWNSTLMALDGCVAAVPDPKPELLEDQEAWMHEWGSVLTNMNACSVRSKELDVALDLNEHNARLLKEGRRAYKELEALVKGWKAKAVGESPMAPIKQLAPSLQASEVEPHGTDGEAANMGEPRAASPTFPVEVHMAGAALLATFPRSPAPFPVSGTNNPRTSASHAHKTCAKHATGRGSAKETASSLAVEDEEDTGDSDMEIEITGERLTGEKVLRGSATILPRAVGPVMSGSAPKGKGKPKDLEVALEEVTAENTHLKEERARLRATVLNMRQHACAHQADLLILSNKLFAMSQDWADVEGRLSEHL